MTSNNEEKYVCKFCDTEIEWEGHDDKKGHIWGCERCGNSVCSQCIEDAGGSVSENADEILCPNCITLEKAYSSCDEKTIEANKKLPKPCFGNSSGYYCNYECSKNNGCYGVTMKKWGVCDCEFKPNCHLSRQMLQEEFKKDRPDYECSFKPYFDKESNLDIEIPEGIIKMSPIID